MPIRAKICLIVSPVLSMCLHKFSRIEDGDSSIRAEKLSIFAMNSAVSTLPPPSLSMYRKIASIVSSSKVSPMESIPARNSPLSKSPLPSTSIFLKRSWSDFFARVSQA